MHSPVSYVIIFVGQTKRSLRERIGEHLTSTRKRKTYIVVGCHYNLAGHQGTSNLIVFILDLPAADSSRKRRKALALEWIIRLRSVVPQALNIAD